MTSSSVRLALAAASLGVIVSWLPAPAWAQAKPQTQSPSITTTGCGRISVFDVAPRSRDLYGARLLEIDGELPGPSGSRTFRVAAGFHKLKVSELIDAKQFSDVALRQRGKGRDLSKTMEIEVKPDTTYLLAAHLIEAHRNDIIQGGYWEPVVYDQHKEPCR
jgi:hypothetical protein